MGKSKGPRAWVTPEGAQVIFDLMVPVVSDAGRRIAGRVPAERASADSRDKRDRNGRPVALVALTEPNGVAIQSKYGTLTRAAAEEGADVHRYPGGR